jgi:hypothetical protein
MGTQAAVLTLVFSLTTAAASAATITFSFAGTADVVSPGLAPTLTVGDALTGTFEFDPLAPIQGCLPDFLPLRCYYSPLQLLSGTLGSYAFQANFTVEVSDNFNGRDGWFLGAGPSSRFGPTSISGPPVNGADVFFFGFDFDDPSGSALNGLELVPPVLDAYQLRRFRLQFNPGEVEGSVTALAPTAVPEPATVLLLAMGVGAIALRRTAQRDEGA